MLYLQGGMASNTDRIIDESWINASFTVGDEDAEQPFGYFWWLGADPVYCSYGFGGQRMCFNRETNRVLAIYSETFIDDVFGEEDPTATAPTDEIVQKFIFADASIDCDAPVNTTKPITQTSSPTSAAFHASFFGTLALFIAALSM